MSKIILIFRILLKKTIGTFLQTLKVGFLSTTFLFFFIFILSRDEFSNISPGGHWFSPPFVLSFYLLQLLWNWFSPRLSALCSQTGQPQLNILIDYENSFSKKLWQSRILNRKGYAYNIYSFFVLDSDYCLSELSKCSILVGWLWLSCTMPTAKSILNENNLLVLK